MSPAQHLRSSRAHVPDMAQTSNSPAAPLTPQQPSSTKSAKASKGQTRDNTEQQVIYFFLLKSRVAEILT